MSLLSFQPLEDVSVALGLSTLDQGLKSDGAKETCAGWSYTGDLHVKPSILSIWLVSCQESPCILSALPGANHLSHYSSEPRNHDDFHHGLHPRGIATAGGKEGRKLKNPQT